MTEQQVLMKLTAICSKAEHCLFEMRTKMDRWEIDKDLQEKILAYLVAEKYIDEERYARAFIRSKKEYNKWGLQKIERALYMKRIPKNIYQPILHEIDATSYEETLIQLLKSKEKSIKFNSDYEKRSKLIRFSLQRGFSYDQAVHCINRMKDESI